MTDESLTPERILEAAEAVLRRFGPVKTTVVDVAPTPVVSHGSIYRHFPPKLRYTMPSSGGHNYLNRSSY